MIEDTIAPLVLRGTPSSDELAAIVSAYTSYIVSLPAGEQEQIDLPLWSSSVALSSRSRQQIRDVASHWVYAHRLVAR